MAQLPPFSVNVNALPPTRYDTWPVKQSVLSTAAFVDLAVFEGAATNLPPIELERIVVNRGANRYAPKPYTIPELQAFARAWGLRPMTRKSDLVEQLRAEYSHRYPTR